MTRIEDEIIHEIDLAFKSRILPTGRIVDKSVNLEFHVEAQRVERYFRDNRDVIDRHNSVLVAFNYFTDDAAMWAIPLYMKSMLKSFNDCDFIIDHFCGALARGTQQVLYKGHSSQQQLGLRLRKLATVSEAAAVCSFCRWLQISVHDSEAEPSIAAALKLWCRSPTL